MTKRSILISLCSYCLVAAPPSSAQTLDAAKRLVQVGGRQMRVAVAGLEGRVAGQPVIVLEAGAPEPTPGFSSLDTWKELWPHLVALGPVVAYERRGIGESALDSEPPTMTRVATVLHDLLATLRIPPPYVLVGHSWGGNYLRAYTDRFSTEVAGLVFVDAETGAGPTREARAAVLPEAQRAAALAPPSFPPIPPTTPPGVRAEFEEMARDMLSDGQQARLFRAVTTVPIAVVVATPPGRMRGVGGLLTRLTIQHTLDFVLSAPNGMMVTASHVSHSVQRDDPVLVAKLVEHVLSKRSRQ